MGDSEGKTVGQWFGPNTIAQVLRLASRQSHKINSDCLHSRRIASNEFDKQVFVHVAMDNTLILEEIRSFSLMNFFVSIEDLLGKACQINSMIPNLIKKSHDTQNSWKPVVIIIPLRLGLNDVNSEYIEQLKVNQILSLQTFPSLFFLLVMFSFTSNSWIYWRKAQSSALFYRLFRTG